MQDTEYEWQEIEFGVAAGPIFAHKFTKGYLGQWYPYWTRWEKKDCGNYQFLGSRAIFLLFYVHQDTESE